MDSKSSTAVEEQESTLPEPEITQAEKIRDQIIHILTIYPVISRTMLQGGLGPQVKPADWSPVLDALVEEGVVLREYEDHMTPSGRYNSYNKLRLSASTTQGTAS